MGTDIFEQLLDKLRAGESFSLQLDELDESVDVSGQAQLVQLEIWCEFRVCRVKALGGDRIANLVSED